MIKNKIHSSDCSLHNEPFCANKPCDCGVGNEDIDIKWLSPCQAANKLKISYRTIMKSLKSGELSSYRFARHYKIDPKDLLDYMRSKKISKSED